MAISTLVETSIGGNDKWSDSVLGADDCIYGIPYNARKVVRFNPVDESMEEIGPDLGDAHGKWKCGVLAHNGCIYCAPFESDLILKIDTIHGTVRTTVLDDDMIHYTANRIHLCHVEIGCTRYGWVHLLYAVQCPQHPQT